MLKKELKAAQVVAHQTHKTDTGSSAVQAAIMTERIKGLTEHLKVNKKDHMARRGLLQLVGRRKRLLTYLARTNESAYVATIAKLGLRK